MELLFFLFEVFVISLSGVLAPGPITATTIVMGARSKYAGPLIAAGHGIVEFPLMVLIVVGMDKFLKSTATQITIGLAGGMFLLIMAAQMLKSTGAEQKQETAVTKSGPVVAGIVLSGGNPYFVVWWATVGLALATTARSLGIWAFVLFAIVHWLCDFVWLSALSWASFRGTVLLGRGVQKVVLVICGAVLLAFGAVFIYNASGMLLTLLRQ